jgi:glycosyltransferase involved in cell wall biosynthesis
LRHNLLFVTDSLGLGGQEKQLCYLLKSIQNKYNCTLVVWNSDANIKYQKSSKYSNEISGMNVELIKFDSTLSSFKKTSLLKKINKRINADLIISYSFYLSFYSWLASTFSKAKAIGSFRSQIVKSEKDINKLFVYLCILLPKYFISNNKNFNKGFSFNFIFKFKKVFIVPNGIDFASVKYNYGEQDEYINSISIGTLNPVKRVDLTIEIIKKLIENGFKIKHTHLGNGKLLEEYRQKINSYGLQNNFIFAGEVENVNEYLSDADVFLLTSDFEGFPNVILEAMASGKPVITTDAGDAGLIVKDNETGFVCKTGDLDCLYKKMSVLMNNFDLRKKMSENTRKLVEENYSMENFVNKSISVFDSVIKD